MTTRERRRGRQPRRYTTAIQIIGGSVAIAAVSLLCGFAQPSPSQASAMTPAGHTRLWWDHQTCGQFATWRRHHTNHSAMATLAGSRHADGYLRTDAGAWYHYRERQPWTGYVRDDCRYTGDQ